MPEPSGQEARISATPAAREAVIRLRAARGHPLMFVQSGGCCAGVSIRKSGDGVSRLHGCV